MKPVVKHHKCWKHIQGIETWNETNSHIYNTNLNDCILIIQNVDFWAKTKKTKKIHKSVYMALPTNTNKEVNGTSPAPSLIVLPPLIVSPYFWESLPSRNLGQHPLNHLGDVSKCRPLLPFHADSSLGIQLNHKTNAPLRQWGLGCAHS